MYSWSYELQEMYKKIEEHIGQQKFIDLFSSDGLSGKTRVIPKSVSARACDSGSIYTYVDVLEFEIKDLNGKLHTFQLREDSGHDKIKEKIMFVDIETEEVGEPRPAVGPVCECGSEKVGAMIHSDYCPLYGTDTVMQRVLYWSDDKLHVLREKPIKGAPPVAFKDPKIGFQYYGQGPFGPPPSFEEILEYVNYKHYELKDLK